MTSMKKARRIGSSVALALVVLCTLTAPAPLAQQDRATGERRYVIAGRVVDPHQLQPEEAVLMLGREENGGFSSSPVAVAADGSFVTPKLTSGTYVLEVVGMPHSATKPAAAVGLSIVVVGSADVSGITVAVRRETAITGTFRMESDDPNAEWPTFIVVNAFLALDGMPFLGSRTAEGAPPGKFVLRNALGPRVLRCGYTLAPGSRWWPSRVVLDGKDITNVPTDFSAHEDGQLEVVFTQHPARIAGTVTDEQGQPVRAPWILVWAADRTLWQEWAATTEVAQGDTQGGFSIARPPGHYVVRAVPQDTFGSSADARRQLYRLAPGGVPVEVEERQVTRVNLTLQER
jgi:hypothetical protein